MTRYRWIAHREAEGFPVAVACLAARISRQAYYAWRHRRNRGEDPEHLVLASELRAIWEASDGTYGSPRVTHELRRRGFCVNHKRVERLMRDLGIAASPPRRFVRTTRQGEDAPLPDLVSCVRSCVQNGFWNVCSPGAQSLTWLIAIFELPAPVNDG